MKMVENSCSRCVLVGPNTGENFTNKEKDLFVLGCGGVEYLRVDFSGESPLLFLKDYGTGRDVLTPVREWVKAMDAWVAKEQSVEEQGDTIPPMKFSQ